MGQSRPSDRYRDPSDDAEQHAARLHFLTVVHRLEPDVSGQLAGEPLDRYRPLHRRLIAEAPPDRARLFWRRVHLSWPTVKHATARNGPDVLRLRQLLQEWAWRWQFADDWVFEAAIATLAAWSDDDGPPAPGPLRYPEAHASRLPFGAAELRFCFEDRGWEPTQESWQATRERIETTFADALRAYEARVRAECEAVGLVGVTPSRFRGNDPWEWLCRHLLRWDLWREIADDAGVSPEAVARGAARKAAAIGLTLPDGRKSRHHAPAAEPVSGATGT